MVFRFNALDYKNYKEFKLVKRWVKLEDWHKVIAKNNLMECFKVTNIGFSLEDRTINSYQWGEGDTRVMLWSQMHGNEPTTTMALADLFNFLSASDEYNPYRNWLRKNFKFLFIPILNPDGAERFSRYNSLSIDLNRDSKSQITVEIQIFMKTFKSFQPHWGFNLHDQRNIFSVGNSNKPATISFLSPPYDESRKINLARLKAMKLIAGLAELTNEHIPGQTGRYTDKYQPRALGEYFHKKEIPCVLIESGADFKDYYRNTARKMNFLILLQAFELIATDKISFYAKENYHHIPENGECMMDLIIRSCQLRVNNKTIKADLGFLIREVPDFNKVTLKKVYSLVEVGDLSSYKGFDEVVGGELAESNPKLEKPANFTIKFEKGSKMKFVDGKIAT